MKPFLLSIILLALCLPSPAQVAFRGVLINTRDSAAIPFAVIKLVETDVTVLGDDKGAFSFTVPANTALLTFRVSVVGYKTTIQHKPVYKEGERVYLEVGAYDLKEAEIRGESAEEIIRKAIAAIPDNYVSTSYFDFTSYRQYQRINGLFVNLIEANPVLMVKLKKEDKKLTATEGLAIRQLRRSRYMPNKVNPCEYRDNNINYVLWQNPVYYLASSALAPDKLHKYRFHFDTTVKTDDYVINYVSLRFSSDKHGIIYFKNPEVYAGEAQEIGTITIDRKTLAFKRIQRTALRNPNFSYYTMPNVLLPDRKYCDELVKGELTNEYECTDGKWHTKSISYAYTNDYFIMGTNRKDYTITDVFELRSDSTSRYVPEELVTEFYPKLRLYGQYTYNKDFWEGFDLPFNFHSRDAVFTDLYKTGSADQFETEGKYVKGKPVDK